MTKCRGNRPFHLHIFILIIFSLLLSSCSDLLKSTAPQRDGKIAGDVTQEVNIYRDRWGVPHIFASSTEDLLYAQGFVHAQERLFQMDTERRLASGRLSEVLGEKTLPIDIIFRTIGLKSKAEAIYEETEGKSKIFIDKYAEGINRFLATTRNFPIEFRVLRYRPDTFEGSDVILTALLKAFGLSQWLEELAYHTVLSKAGVEYFEEINPFGKDISEIDLLSHTIEKTGNGSLHSLSKFFEASFPFPSFPHSGGSNSWVISGTKSVDGIPHLANDPHLPLSVPSVWIENHLISPELNVYGVSFPGAPFVIIGFNENVAWGFTNVMLDDVDFFIEKEMKEGETYLYKGQEQNFIHRKEVIPVKGKDPQEIDVRESIHGPMITSIFPGVNQEFSFRWAGLDASGNHLKTLHLLNRARNVHEIREALSYFELTAQNVLFATQDGDIGYQLAGKIPLRKKNHPPVPVPGHTGEFDWNGYLPFNKNPFMVNPRDGFIATANFPPLPSGVKPYISSIYEPPARGKRIIEVLSRKGKISEEELRDLQVDIFSHPAKMTVPLILQVVEAETTEDETYRKAITLLKEWDMTLTADSQAAALFEVFYEFLIEGVFLDELGQEGFTIFKRTLRVPIVSLDYLLFDKPRSKWFDNTRTPERENREKIIADAFKMAVTYLKDEFGKNPKEWNWGRLHKVTMRHPFGEKWYLRKFFNIKPAPVGGDGRTVFKTEFPHGFDFSAIVGPSMRMVVSPQKPDGASMLISTGQSGHFFEKHYRDQVGLWLNGGYRRVLFNREETKKNFTHHMKIIPGE